MKKTFLKKEITNHKKLVNLIILIITLTFIGINGFSNPFKNLKKQENMELEFIEKNNTIYYKLEGVNYVIINEHLSKAKGNWVVKATYYDSEFKTMERKSYITKKGYNCFKKNSTASFLTVELEPQNNITMLGSEAKWIDLKSSIIIALGIIVVYLIQYGIFTLKRLYSK